MTSKEKLERIENFIYGSPITKEYREKLNTNVKEIKKDLEVLEILKKTLNNSFLCLIKNKEEQEKIKEWLDNETKI